VIVGEEVAELAVDEEGITIGIEIGSLDPFDLVIFMGEPVDEWDSRRYEMDGETARRFELFGYGSKRSSTDRLRLLERTALVVGGGVYRQ